MRSLYESLGIERSAGRQVIKRAYYAAAHTCHPDKCPNDPAAAQRFREISLAYTVLGDPAARKRYDLFGPVALGLSPSLTDLSVLGPEGERLAQAVGSVMARMITKLRSKKSPKVTRVDLHVDVGMALRGGTQTLQIRRKRRCPDCTDTRASEAPKNKTLQALCPSCHNRQVVEQVTQFQVRIPADSGPKDVLKLTGAGSLGEDVLVQLVIDPHPVVRVRGLDLYLDLWIAPTQAALGGTLQVPMPHRTLTLPLTAGAQDGHIVALPGEGLRGGASKRGDVHVTLQIETPVLQNEAHRGVWAALEAHEATCPAAYPQRTAMAHRLTQS